MKNKLSMRCWVSSKDLILLFSVVTSVAALFVSSSFVWVMFV